MLYYEIFHVTWVEDFCKIGRIFVLYKESRIGMYFPLFYEGLNILQILQWVKGFLKETIDVVRKGI